MFHGEQLTKEGDLKGQKMALPVLGQIVLPGLTETMLKRSHGPLTSASKL